MADLSHTPTGRAADADAADRTYVGLAKQIYDLITAGGVAPRARLPSERTLAERFGVSRTLVREAIIALEMQGVVEVRHGDVRAQQAVGPRGQHLQHGVDVETLVHAAILPLLQVR